MGFRRFMGRGKPWANEWPLLPFGGGRVTKWFRSGFVFFSMGGLTGLDGGEWFRIWFWMGFPLVSVTEQN